ncbi:hypothetical protein NP233_g4193 [Leucocoprinus birnbaumii]|uniref:Uncharacterized protein n=1 Tax=Leucocoprinus birnbaumii TaxID=56174 RepID=A0AAD5VYW3_9AGAR|nr:hypothetical protein NP233_g4193 [Leucocoprinus birnbaumii]
MTEDPNHRVFSIIKQEQPGRAWVTNGDLYYSPNCIRGVGIPEHQQDINLKPGVSKASDFQEPIWWDKKTEWLAFVIRQPVPYSGAIVDALNVVPDTLISVPNKGVRMLPEAALPWKELEVMLIAMAQALEDSLPYVVRAVCIQGKPFPPSKWGYDTFYPIVEEASRHIEAGRDWFAMWLGYVYWLSKKVYEHSGYTEDLTAPLWYLHIVRACNDQPMYDLLRTTPLLQNHWKWNRVGVWLHHPDDVEEQPTAQWFVDRGAPVWYRWGGREKATMRSGNRHALIQPKPEELQHATTWIAPTPSTTYTIKFPASSSSVTYTPVPASPDNVYMYQNSYGRNSTPDVWMPTVSTGPPSSAAKSSIGVQQSAPASTGFVAEKYVPDEAVNASSSSIMSSKAARRVWNEFWGKREALHEKMLKAESDAKKMTRVERERMKPVVSTIVYEWGWDEDETPPIFTKKLVRKADRAETIARYGKEIRRYDSYMNEWHLCHKFTDTESPGSSMPSSSPQESHSIGSLQSSIPSSSIQNVVALIPSSAREAPSSVLQSSVPPLPPSFLAYNSGDPNSNEFKMERTRTEVLRLLGRRFGFVPPLPVPLRISETVLETHMKGLLTVLGMETDKASLDFFKTPLGRICVIFMKSFTGKGEERPSSDIWDLSRGNRQTLAFNVRVGSIRMLECAASKRWYMFDMGAARTVKWNIAVSSAADALYVCRLDNKMTEKEIALDLAEEGVRFHTVQRRDTLGMARKDRSASTYVPMRLSGHAFNKRDFDFYHKQAEFILSLPRARAAIMRGGFARRIAIDYLSISEVTKGPRGIDDEEGHMFIAKDSAGVEYVDDGLTVGEYDALCGLYLTFTGSGQQVAKLSWYPLTYVFDGQGEDMGWWTGRAERLWESCNASILSSDPNRKLELPKAVMKWRDRVRGFGDGRRAAKSLEEWSRDFLKSELGEL